MLELPSTSRGFILAGCTQACPAPSRMLNWAHQTAFFRPLRSLDPHIAAA
jgi:hypothetical protein